MNARPFSSVTRSLLLATALLASLLVDTATAQESAQQVEQNPFDKPVSVEFAGGSVAQYVDVIRQAAPGINIVITGSAADYAVPEIQLKQVPAIVALECLNRATSEQIFVEYPDYIAYVQNQDQSTTNVRVINVKQLLNAIDKADLLTAIEVGLEMQDKPSLKVDLKLHEETGLLFVKGLENQTSLIEEIVNQMSEGALTVASRRGPGLGGGFGGSSGGAAAGGGGRPDEPKAKKEK